MGVFNTSTNQVKLINILPHHNWGGTGLIGCEFGTGLLHRLPLHLVHEKEPEILEPIVP